MSENVSVNLHATDNASKPLDSVSRMATRAGKSVDGMTGALNRAQQQSRKTQGQFKMMRGGMGQLGHQIQDITVMMQAGQSPFIIMAQQGSQIASLFGKRGAVYGAILAIGAVIVGTLAYSALQAQKELAKLGDEALEAAKSTDVLSDAMRTVIVNQLTSDIIELQDKIEAYQDIVDNTGKFNWADLLDVNSYKYAFAAMTGSTEMFVGTLKDIQNDSDKAVYGIEKSTNQVELLSDQLKSFKSGENPLFSDKEAKEAARNLQSFSDKLIGMKRNLVMTEQQLLRIQAVEASGGDMATLIRLNAEIDAYFKLKDSKDASAAASKAQIAADKQASKEKQSFINTLERQLNTLTLTEVQTLQLQASTLNLNEAEKHLLDTVIKELNAKTALNEQLKIEKSLKEQLSKSINDMATEANKFNQIQAELSSPLEREKAVYDQRMEWLESLRETEMANLLNIDSLKQSLTQRQMESEVNAQLALIGGFEGLQQAGEQALSSIILQGGTLKDALHGVADTITSSVITSIVSMGVEYVKQKLVGAAIEKAALGSSVAAATVAGASIATAMTPAAVMMSLATAGGNSVGAIAGIEATSLAAMAMNAASFEGGGVTFNGVRSGGVDGKGGKMAVVHPNEKITDMEQGGSTGQPLSVQFNINAVDAKGIDQLLYERRGAITAMVQKAVNNSGRRI